MEFIVAILAFFIIIALIWTFAPWLLVLAGAVIIALIIALIISKRESKSALRKLEKEYTIDYDIYTKLVGVTFNGIQNILPGLKPGMPVILRHEKNNPYDKNAILALCNGNRIGHLSADLASDIAPLIDKGIPVTGVVQNITGGGYGKSYGCNIKILVYKPKGDNDSVTEPVNKISELTCQVENIDESNPFYLKNCAIFGTGKTSAAQCVVNLGGIVKNRVNKDTDFVIALSADWLNGPSANAAIANEIISNGGKLKVLNADEYKAIIDKYLSK